MDQADVKPPSSVPSFLNTSFWLLTKKAWKEKTDVVIFSTIALQHSEEASKC